MYLIDTSIWIDFLRNKSTTSVQKLEELMSFGEVGINEIIYNEICFGARDINQFSKYRHYFGQIPFYSLQNGWHEQVAAIRFKLKKNGVTSFLPDSMIAYTALAYDLTLVTKDQDFESFVKYCGIKLLIL